MTTKHSTRWITPDLLDAQAVSLPQDFEMKPGSYVDIIFPDGRTGRLTVTDEPNPDRYRGRWTCQGSNYDGRDFDLSWGTRSDISPLGRPVVVPVNMLVVT